MYRGCYLGLCHLCKLNWCFFVAYTRQYVTCLHVPDSITVSKGKLSNIEGFLPFIMHSQAKVFLSCPEPLTEFGSARDVGWVQEYQDLDTCHDGIDRIRITKCCGTLLLHRFRESSSSVCYSRMCIIHSSSFPK